MSNVQISIVTISFNQFAYLPDAIESIQKQQNVSWELIVVDPGSTDGSREYLQTLAGQDPRIRLILESDSGPADGLNKGFQAAAGNIVGYLNADDYYLENIFERVVQAFSKNPTSVCVYAHGMILENGRLRFQSSDKFSLENYALRRGLVMQQSTFFNWDILKDSLVKFNDRNMISWDGEFLVDIGIHDFKLTRVADVWGVFRIYSASITGSGKFRNDGESEFQRIRGKISDFTGLSNRKIALYVLIRPLYSLNRRVLNIIRFYKFRKLYE